MDNTKWYYSVTGPGIADQSSTWKISAAITPASAKRQATRLASGIEGDTLHIGYEDSGRIRAYASRVLWLGKWIPKA